VSKSRIGRLVSELNLPHCIKRGCYMKTRSVLLIVVLLLVGIVASVIDVSASSPAIGYKLQKIWFLAGGLFDIASAADHITLFMRLLTGEVSPGILDRLREWQSGILKKEEVRVVLLDYLRTQGDLWPLEAFLMGEWVSNVENSVIDVLHRAENEDLHLLYEAMVNAHVLACQARGFIDTFASTAPQEVLQALEQIADRGSKIDIAGMITRDADNHETVRALHDLLDLCKSINKAYGLGD